MKKQIIAIFMLFFMMFAGFGCSCKKDDSYLKDIDEATLDKMKVDGESFVLFVYQIGCHGCERFKPILNSAIEEKKVVVYGINIRTVENDTDLMTSIEYTPSLVVYKEGKIEMVTDPDKNENYFVDKEGVLSFLDEHKDVFVKQQLRCLNGMVEMNLKDRLFELEDK